MTSVLEGVGKDAAYSVFGKLKEWYSYIESYSDNIRALEGKHRELTDLKETINSQLERESDNLRKPTKVTQGWLERVETLLTKEELTQLLDEEIRKGKDQCCFGRMQCNLYHRYDMSKASENMAKELDAEINKKPDSSMVTELVSVSDLKSAPGEFLGSLQSRVELMDKILSKLEDDDVDFVGIFGMGAIGKTTLVKEISNKAKTKFGKTVMVEISEAPNMERIQYQIADQLGIKDLSDAHSVEHKATMLHTGLTRKGSRTLVILDNIWEKLDLRKVGIPQQSEKSSEFCCKLMVTTRKKDVCKVMGVQDTENIFEVHPLDQTEAKLLFRARVGKTDDMNEHDKEVENRILKKCGGLPLSIVLIADVLKGQELSTWEHYARELEKPSSMLGSIKDANRLTNSILGTSYRLIESEEKKKFFLLACLFPFGSSIRVDDMMRYGIGKGLFQDVNNLNEAIDQAHIWAYELVSSSLLLPELNYGTTESLVKIQDVVRGSTIALAKQDGEVFMVEAFPRWRELETCKKYTAISLMSDTDHSRLRGLMSDNLEMLLLDNTKPPKFDDTLFEHMNNLKVLVLSGTNRKRCDGFLRIPTNSFQRWKSSLRMLHLEHCRLGYIEGIGELVNLVVLSLRYSRLKQLPGEAIMGNLVKLRLLDLSYCQIRSEGIPAKVLARLSQLEGLYLSRSNITKWGHNSVQATGGTKGASTSSTQHAADEGSDFIDDDKYASIDELNRLSYLNLRVMEVPLKDLPTQGDQFVKNLERFKVEIPDTISEYSDFNLLRRSVSLSDLDLRKKESGCTERRSASSSMQDTDDDVHVECTIDDKFAIIDELNRLSYLNVLEMKVRLEDLPIQGDQFVKNLERFKVEISHNISGGVRVYSLSRSAITLSDLDLRKMRIIKCVKALLLKTEELILYSVKGFEEQYLHDEKEFIRWGNLKYLTIRECNEEVVESIKWSAFPNLETLDLKDMDNSSIIGHSSSVGDEAQVGGRAATLSATGKITCRIFSNLQRLSLSSLKNLKPYVMPIHVLPLNQLTSLRVFSCEKLKYIFGEAEKETDQKNKDPHPHLKLPLLRELHLHDLYKLESMVEVPNSSEDEDPPPLFTTKLIFGAALESVYLESLNSIERLWDVAYWKGKDNADYRSSFLNLNSLFIESCGKLKTLCPVSVAVALVHLKTLYIEDCGEMREAVVKDEDDQESDCDGRDHGVPFPSLEELELWNCPKMAHFINAKQSYVFTSLEHLIIRGCHEMQSLSAGPATFRAPNLTYFDYDQVKQSIPEGGEINEILKARYQQRTHPVIPALSSERASEGDIEQLKVILGS